MPFQIALSGLNAASTSLNTTANNIANVNTTGFKGSRANFVELFASGLQDVQQNATGIGARTSSIQQLFSQGSLEFSSNNLDLALIGEGFFTLADDQGAFTYTRAGNFGVNSQGDIVNDQGLKLQGFEALEGGRFNTGQPIDLSLETTNSPPSATGLINVGLNLPSDASAPESNFDVAVIPPPADTFNHTTSTTIFDSLGRARTATYYFVKVDADDTETPPIPENQWQAYLTIDDQAVTVGPATLQFLPNGQLDPDLPTEFPFFNPGNPTADPAVPDADGFDATPAEELFITADFSDLTQFGSSFNVTSLRQDGNASGRLASIEITKEGVVSARFTNGQTQALGQVTITNFANPEGLENVSDTRWAETADSGQALRGAAGTGNFGEIQSGALETANVDLAKELVDMITAQRTFQANAQMITTADQITQTVLNIR